MRGSTAEIPVHLVLRYTAVFDIPQAQSLLDIKHCAETRGTDFEFADSMVNPAFVNDNIHELLTLSLFLTLHRVMPETFRLQQQQRPELKMLEDQAAQRASGNDETEPYVLWINSCRMQRKDPFTAGRRRSMTAMGDEGKQQPTIFIDDITDVCRFVCLAVVSMLLLGMLW